MVTVCGPAFSGSTGGQMLAMLGVMLCTSTLTRMFCDFAVTVAPEATTVMLAVYGTADGARLVASTFTVSVCRSPGSTMPTAGETDSQVAPAVAVKEIGESLVDMVTVCATDGLGGAVKIKLDGLNINVDGGEVTSKFTVTTAGEAIPATAMVTADVYVPTARLVGFTSTPMEAGSVPLSMFTVNQKSVAGVDVVKVGLPVLGFTAMV